MGSWLHHTPCSSKWPLFSKGTPSQNCMSSEDHQSFYWGHIRSPSYLSQSLPEGKRAGIWAWDRKSLPSVPRGSPQFGTLQIGALQFGCSQIYWKFEETNRAHSTAVQSRRPYSYTVPWPSCTQWLYPPHSPPWPIPEPPSQIPAPEIFLPSLSRAISLHDRLPPTWAPRGSLHIQRLITALFQIVRRLLQGSGSLGWSPSSRLRWVDHYSNPSLLLWGPLKGRILRFGIWKGTGSTKLLSHTQWLSPFYPLPHVERLSQQRLGDICL